MKYMNDYDLQRARVTYIPGVTPNRHRVTYVVSRLAIWADANSDGWCYWPKPCRAAAKAIALIDSETNAINDHKRQVDATDAEVKGAISPIKAFLTRQGVSRVDRDWILGPVS
jgi:hypothetical protein